MNKKTVEDIDVKGKKVLVRCDFNVPLDENKKITDNRRIVAALQTINYLINNNAKVILCSHLGRPKGEYKLEYSLKPVQEELERLLEKQVKLAKDVVGEDAKNLVENMQDGEVILLENVRFESAEEKNDEEFSKQLASLAQIYVNDAFGTAHRAHSSTEGVSHYLPAVAGFLIKKEIEILGDTLKNPERPFISILGGAKVSDKIGVIENLLDKVDAIIIGGGMSYTFNKSLGHQIGDSLCELDKLDLARDLLKRAEEKNVKIYLPVDTHIATEFSNDAPDKYSDSKNIPDGWQGLDIGPETISKYKNILRDAKTIIWNGPLGVCEFPKYRVGTEEIAKAISSIDATTIIGGGDSAAAIEQLGLADKMTHISTGGGASLEFLEGKILPGIECLQNK